MKPYLLCPPCGSNDSMKNGTTRRGKQNYTSRLVVQLDELWSCVDEKGNKQWVWLAIDVDTREIIGCHVGDPWKLQ